FVEADRLYGLPVIATGHEIQADGGDREIQQGGEDAGGAAEPGVDGRFRLHTVQHARQSAREDIDIVLVEDDHRVVHLDDWRAGLGQSLHFISQFPCQRYLDLLAVHLDRHLVLDARKLLARYFAAVAAVDGLAQTGRAGTVRDLGVVADDSCLHGSAFLFCGRFQLLDLFLDLAQLILVLTAILLEHLQVLITAGKRQALRNQKPSGGANRSGTSVAAMSDRNQRRNTGESQSSIGYGT